MASRPLLSPYPVITNGNMSGSITSAVTIIQNISLLSYAISWSGASPVGDISVQVSNDYAVNPAGSVSNAGTWNTITLSNTTPVSGNSGTGFIDIDSLAGYAVRLVYTFTSGTGTMQATVSGKVS